MSEITDKLKYEIELAENLGEMGIGRKVILSMDEVRELHALQNRIDELELIQSGIEEGAEEWKAKYENHIAAIKTASQGDFKYFKFDKQTAVIIGNILSMFCEQAKAETKNEKQNLAVCRQKFMEYIQQFNAQLDAQQIEEILQDLEAEKKEQNKPGLIYTDRPKLILLKRD